jgi:hypothetical protein
MGGPGVFNGGGGGGNNASLQGCAAGVGIGRGIMGHTLSQALGKDEVAAPAMGSAEVRPHTLVQCPSPKDSTYS